MSVEAIKKNASHKDWLLFATNDIRLAKKALHDEECVCPALHLTQQAAEKALKAFLAYHKKDIERTHDLVLLVYLCEEVDATFVNIRKYAKSLHIHTSKVKYPDLCLLIPDLTTLKISIGEVENILSFVEERIK